MKSILVVVVLAATTAGGQSASTGTATSNGVATWPVPGGGGSGSLVCGPPNYNCAVKNTDPGEPAVHGLPGWFTLRLANPSATGQSAPAHLGGPYGANMIDLDNGFSSTTYGGHSIFRATDLNSALSAGGWSESLKRSWSPDDSLIQLSAHGGTHMLVSFNTTNRTVRKEWLGGQGYLGQTSDWGTTAADISAHAFYAWTNSTPYLFKRWLVNTSAGAPGDPSRTVNYTVSTDSNFNGGLGFFDPQNSNCAPGGFPSTTTIRNAYYMDNAAGHTREAMFGGGTAQDKDFLYIIWDATEGCRVLNSQTMQMSNGWNAGTSNPVDATFDSHAAATMRFTVTQRSRSSNVATITYTPATQWYNGCSWRGQPTPQDSVNVEVNEDSSFNSPLNRLTTLTVGQGVAFDVTQGSNVACTSSSTISYANTGPDVAPTTSTGKVIKGWGAHGMGLDLSGQWVNIGSANPDLTYNGSMSWDPDTNIINGCDSTDPCIYHRARGWGNFIYSGAYGTTMQFDVRQQATLFQHTKVADSGVTLTAGADDHIACINCDQANDLPAWKSDWNANSTQPRTAYDGEILGVYYAGANIGTFRRFAHVFGAFTGGLPVSPQCQVSVDGLYSNCSSDFQWYMDFNGISLTDGAITAGSANLSSASANFQAGDVNQWIRVIGAFAVGPSNSDLVAQISTVTDAHDVILSKAATVSVTGATVQYNLMWDKGWGDGNGNYTCDNTLNEENSLSACRNDALFYDLAGGTFEIVAPTWVSVASGASQIFFANSVWDLPRGTDTFTWSTTDPGGSFSTDANDLSAKIYTAGTQAGTYTVSATSTSAHAAGKPATATAIVVVH